MHVVVGLQIASWIALENYFPGVSKLRETKNNLFAPNEGFNDS